MDQRFEFFELLTPADLFKKIELDLAMLESSSNDIKIAFNFFVSAEHLPDWLGLRHLVRKHGILRVVSHIANGAKHFTLKDERHKSVTKAEKSRYADEGYFEDDYMAEPLVIYLSATEAEEIGAPQIDVLTLGKQVIEFWRPYVQNA